MDTSGSRPSVVSSASPSPSEPAPPSTSEPSSEYKIERYTILSTPDGDDLYYLWERSDLCDGAHWQEAHRDYLPETKTFWLTAIINPKDTSFFERLIYTDPSIKNWFPLAKLEEAGGSVSENPAHQGSGSKGSTPYSHLAMAPRLPSSSRLVPCIWPPPGQTLAPSHSFIWPASLASSSSHLVNSTDSTAITNSVLGNSAAGTVPMTIMSDEEYSALEEQCRAKSMMRKSEFQSLAEYQAHRVKLDELMHYRLLAMKARHKAWAEMDYSSS